MEMAQRNKLNRKAYARLCRPLFLVGDGTNLKSIRFAGPFIAGGSNQ